MIPRLSGNIFTTSPNGVKPVTRRAVPARNSLLSSQECFMKKNKVSCPVCDGESIEFDRRQFIKVAGATAAAAALPAVVRSAESDKAAPETLVKKLYDSLSEAQRKEV